MTMTPITFNPNVLEKPTYKVGSQWGINVYTGGQNGGETGAVTSGGATGIANQNMPVAQGFNYEQNIAGSAGYQPGISRWSIIG